MSRVELPQTLEGAHALILRLFERIEALEHRLNQNSHNSSRPPSSDPPNVARLPKKRPSGRKPGGQPGHEGHQRILVPPEQVTSRKDRWPNECENCGEELPEGAARVDAAEPRRMQTVDVPEIKPPVHEECYHGQMCSHCAHVTWAKPGPGGAPPAFGPRLTALVALFTGGYRLSKRAVRVVLHELLGIEMSLGAVSSCEETVSEAVGAPVEEARQHVRDQPVLNADETSWKQKTQRVWLWVAVATYVTVFWILPRRNRVSAHEVLGKFCGTLGTDRYVAYDDYPLERRQFCWAHLRREFKAMRERRGRVGRLGKELLKLSDRMFQWWYQVRDGRMSRSTFQRKMRPLQAQVEALLEQGVRCRDAKRVSV